MLLGLIGQYRSKFLDPVIYSGAINVDTDGFSTKIHLLCNAAGLPMRTEIYAGQTSDYLGFVDITFIRLWIRHLST